MPINNLRREYSARMLSKVSIASLACVSRVNSSTSMPMGKDFTTTVAPKARTRVSSSSSALPSLRT
ncbi:hypothetical protein D3C71_1921740 [compost metagenome]